MGNTKKQPTKLTEHDLCQLIKKEVPETRNMIREMGSVMVFLKNLNMALDAVNTKTSRRIVVKIEFED